MRNYGFARARALVVTTVRGATKAALAGARMHMSKVKNAELELSRSSGEPIDERIDQAKAAQPTRDARALGGRVGALHTLQAHLHVWASLRAHARD